VQAAEWLVVLPIQRLVYLVDVRSGVNKQTNKQTNLDFISKQTLAISLPCLNIYRRVSGKGSVANICTRAPFLRRDKYPRVTNICQMYLSWERGLTERMHYKLCSFPNVMQKILMHKLCGACSMRKRDEMITEFSSENMKEEDHSCGLCAGLRLSLVLKSSFEECDLTIWVEFIRLRVGTNRLRSL
jgi:hypothetical protein